MFKEDDIKNLSERGLAKNTPRTQDERLKMNEERRVRNKELKENFMIELKNRKMNPKVGVLLLNNILDVVLINDSNKSMVPIIKEGAIPFLIEKEICINSKESLDFIIEYINTSSKGVLNKVRKYGIESVERTHNRDIKNLIEIVIGTSIRYFTMDDKFNDLDQCKKKIIEVLQAVGIFNSEEDVNRILRENFGLRKNKILAKKDLEKFIKENYEISKKILGRLAEIKDRDVDINNLLEIEGFEVGEVLNTEGIKEEKRKFEVIELKDDEEEAQSSESEVKCKPQEHKEDEKVKQKINSEYENLITRADDLEFQNLMLSSEVSDLKEELSILHREKEENLEYSANQYQEGLKSVVNALNSPVYGCMLDQIYKLSKGKIDNINPKSLGTNLLRAMQEIGIRAIEAEKIGNEVQIDGENIYTYRVDKGIEDYSSVKGIVASPAWFYKREKLINQLLNIEEC